MHDLTCAGLTTLDIVARPITGIPEGGESAFVEQIVLAPAGTAGGTATVAAKLGLDTALVSKVGRDRNGKFVLDMLTEGGVDTTNVAAIEQMATSTTILTITPTGERPNFHMVGASVMSELDEAALQAAKSSRFFHFAGLGFPMMSGADIHSRLSEIKRSSTRITCDLISVQPNTLDELKRLLPLIEVFMPSVAEAQALLGDGISPAEAARKFVAMGAASSIIKTGETGSIGCIDGEIIHIPARAITAVDTTSCGDSYCAGVIKGLLAGHALVEAMRLGTVTASLVAQGAGTTGILESAEQVETLLKADA